MTTIMKAAITQTMKLTKLMMKIIYTKLIKLMIKVLYMDEKSPEDMYVSINDLKRAEQMNTTQLNTYAETRKELTEKAIHMAIQNNHNYNLRPRPTERNK